MCFSCINFNDKTISGNIPLTTPNGKIRVKQRDNIYDYGVPFSSRQNQFNPKNYIEWQIAYDKDLTTLNNLNFVDCNKKTKSLCELSEYLYYGYKFDLICKSELEELKIFIANLQEYDLIDRHHDCSIHRTYPIEKTINNTSFESLEVKYPQLIYKFKNYEIITEITIREKQRAVGIQPMLFFCFPISELVSGSPLIGRIANKNEFASFEFNKDNISIVLEMVKIFGMLSLSH